MAANEAAISVFKKAATVTSFTANSLPALKPYQPNHNKAVPIATNGILFGTWFRSFRAPTKYTEASAANPAVA